jgi:hypothetical protein
MIRDPFCHTSVSFLAIERSWCSRAECTSRPNRCLCNLPSRRRIPGSFLLLRAGATRRLSCTSASCISPETALIRTPMRPRRGFTERPTKATHPLNSIWPTYTGRGFVSPGTDRSLAGGDHARAAPGRARARRVPPVLAGLRISRAGRSSKDGSRDPTPVLCQNHRRRTRCIAVPLCELDSASVSRWAASSRWAA